ncbi:ABC transporter permease [Nocardioides islandensis]|jgi:peptide/nickel transport system permease protein|uniref:ABC transporter permease n=1 Tax=Nocardioides islandensis TaxID=433663 RepID=A0A930V834_9ACTN|nr:ABC transporter permease [Nocardioides islandensis]MBF4761628.1 ABC transporter permease [Nocardioides islandensis]
MTTEAVDAGRRGNRRERGAIRRALRGALRSWRGRIGLVMALAVLALAFLGPLVAPHAATDFVALPSSPRGPGYPLGSDGLGQDVLSRVLLGGRKLLLLAVLSTGLALVLGTLIGVTAAYRRGWAETALMRGVDVLLAFPQLVFVLLVVSVLGTPTWLLVLTVAIAQAPQIARVVHAGAQDICERDFVQAVALWGVPPRQVIARHVLPSLSTPLAVEAGLRLGFSIVIISGLNFLGFGVQPGTPSWGVMINENRLGMASNPWGVVAPALVLAILAIGTNLFTDAFARAAFGEDRADDTVIGSGMGATP